MWKFTFGNSIFRLGLFTGIGLAAGLIALVSPGGISITDGWSVAEILMYGAVVAIIIQFRIGPE